MGSIDIFLFYSQNGRPKTQRKSITASQSNQSCWERGRNGVFLCPNRKDRELNICTFPLVCLYSRNAVNVVQHLMFISQRTLQVSSYHFSHLFIAAGMIKSAVHHFWDLGRKWLNMLSTDTRTCIHQHYFSRVIVGILFCLFVWRRMKPVDEDINSMATKCCTTVWTHQISAVKTAFMNSSTATAQMLKKLHNWTTGR